MWNIMSQTFVKSGRSVGNDDNCVHNVKREQFKEYGTHIHIWVFRTSIIVAVLLLISFYFIPFPINLILFMASLVIFLMISFWVHIRVKRQSKKESNDYVCNRLSGDQSFVEVPLEQITDNGLKREPIFA